ncbi:MAG: hypothetical protein ACQER7_05505 [Bacteroidota bacterium]
MRRTKLFLGIALIGLLGAGAFTSCEEDEGAIPLPTITFTNDVDTVELEPGDSTHTITGTVTAEGDLEYVKYFKVTDQGEEQLDMVEEFDDPQNYNFSYTVTEIDQDMRIKVEATDEENQTVSRNFDIDFTPPEDVISSYTDKLLGSYDSDEGSSFASVDGTVYTWEDATNNSEKIDYLYYYGDNNGATLAAPNDGTAEEDVYPGLTDWDTQNATTFTTTSLTAEDFDEIPGTDDSEITSSADEADQSAINDLSEGDVVAFITASTSENPEKKGLVKIVTIEGEGGTSTMEIAVKVQK